MTFSEQDARMFMRRVKGNITLPSENLPAPVIPKDKMNKWERAYVNEVLQPQLFAKEILDYKYEPFSMRIAKATFYTPDFFVTHPSHFEIIEIKGQKRQHAIARFKAARGQFPYFVWRMIGRQKGQWVQLSI